MHDTMLDSVKLYLLKQNLGCPAATSVLPAIIENLYSHYWTLVT